MASLSPFHGLGSQAASWPWALGPLTFLAVMLVVVEDEATATLALVAAEGVDAVLLAAAVVLGALVLVCRGASKGGPVCARAKGSGTPREVGGLAGHPPHPGGGRAGSRDQGDGGGPGHCLMQSQLRGPSCAERKLKWTEGGLGSGADQHGHPLPLPAYWTDGQVEKQTHGQADCKRKEQDAGVPLLLHNRKCHRHHQNGRGRGQGGAPVHVRGVGARRAPVLSGQREVGRQGRAEVGVGGCKAPSPFRPR